MSNEQPIRIWRIRYTLLEPMFFASREIDNVYLCEALLTSYGQPYALGWVASSYRLSKEQAQRPHYQEDLEPLNQRSLYLTPAMPVASTLSYQTQRFNAMAETYWYQMSQGVVICTLEDRAKKSVGALNRPQQGHFRLVGAGTSFESFALAPTKPPTVPYCRLGKMMSKARVEVFDLGQAHARQGTFRFGGLLNPADLPEDVKVLTFRLLNVRPVPLLEGAVFEGPYWRVNKNALIDEQTTIPVLVEQQPKDATQSSDYIDIPRGMFYRFPSSQQKPPQKKKSSPNKAESASKPMKQKAKSS